MKKIAILHFLLIAAIFSTKTVSQNSNLQIPLNIKKAIEKGTRSLDGKPGVNYWQNNAEYVIKATVEPTTRKVSGEEEIIYYNNSPDTLKQIVFRLYQDLFRRGNARDFEVDPTNINNGVEIKSLSICGHKIDMILGNQFAERKGTNLIVKLSKPLAPKSEMEIEAKWSFIIPEKSDVRMGTYDSTSFFISYWYPQVAVYDDIDGWDVQNYTGQTEMYNDFNNYKAEINVPKNFLVWATGILQNPEDVLAENILDKYNKAFSSNEVVRIVNTDDYLNGMVTVDEETLTYKYEADHVPDFCFALSDHYLWDASTLTVDKQNDKKTFIAASYNKVSKDFYDVALIARKAIESLSNHLPGWPFPYPSMTAFNGQGGMEYPMMVNDSSEPELQWTVHLTSHEISHTYFPFFMGINERKYAWMDEGWATMLPSDFQTENAPGYDPKSRNAQSYSEFAGKEEDVPPMVLSYELHGPAYRTASYRRPGAAYETLRQMLGEDLFKKCLHEYIDRWNGKHPLPYDFFFSFSEAAGQNLDWFFRPWFFETKYPDLSLTVSSSTNNVNISVTNIGGIPLPVVVKVFYDDGTEEIILEKQADVWRDGNNVFNDSFVPKKKIKMVELGLTNIPDVDLKNNTFEF